MEPWTWILVYLVGFTLFQLLLFRYFSDGRSVDGVSLSSGEATGPQAAERGQQLRETSQRSESERDGVHCPHCGTENADEQNFAYCRSCLAQIH